MIRPFDMRDLPLLARVKDRGLCLASQLAFTRGPQALQAVLLDAFSGARGPATIVVRSDGALGIGQLLHRPDQPHARLAFIAPAELMEGEIGIELLEGLGRSAGERGAHHLIAEVDEESPAFEVLRRAGFAIYARQRIWRLAAGTWVPPTRHEQRGALKTGDASTVHSSLGTKPEVGSREPAAGGGLRPEASGWRPEAKKDSLPIRTLYGSLVPGLVQQVEPPSDRVGSGMVHYEAGELLGYIDLERGPLGEWMQPYFHPAAGTAEMWLAAFLEERDRRQPLYVCVRSYQSWMNGALQRLGFEPARDQAVMVRSLVAVVRDPSPANSPALERARAEPGPAGYGTATFEGGPRSAEESR
jgi:hypothetical protein